MSIIDDVRVRHDPTARLGEELEIRPAAKPGDRNTASLRYAPETMSFGDGLEGGKRLAQTVRDFFCSDAAETAVLGQALTTVAKGETVRVQVPAPGKNRSVIETPQRRAVWPSLTESDAPKPSIFAVGGVVDARKSFDYGKDSPAGLYPGLDGRYRSIEHGSHGRQQGKTEARRWGAIADLQRTLVDAVLQGRTTEAQVAAHAVGCLGSRAFAFARRSPDRPGVDFGALHELRPSDLVELDSSLRIMLGLREEDRRFDRTGKARQVTAYGEGLHENKVQVTTPDAELQTATEAMEARWQALTVTDPRTKVVATREPRRVTVEIDGSGHAHQLSFERVCGQCGSSGFQLRFVEGAKSRALCASCGFSLRPDKEVVVSADIEARGDPLDFGATESRLLALAYGACPARLYTAKEKDGGHGEFAGTSLLGTWTDELRSMDGYSDFKDYFKYKKD
jgi:hypothetical protein